MNAAEKAIRCPNHPVGVNTAASSMGLRMMRIGSKAEFVLSG